MKDHYDVIVFGAGPAGTAAAFGLAKSKSVLVIENDLFGGTCPNGAVIRKKCCIQRLKFRTGWPGCRVAV